MHNLPPDQLAALLRANAKGVYATEAATELLIRHGHWLDRRDFQAICVQAEHDEQTTWAWVEWDNVVGFLEDAPCSSSEGRVLQLASEIAGADTGIPLGELLIGLDDHNSRLVVAAVAHTLHAGPTLNWTPPVTRGHEQPRLPDGNVDVRALCHQWDDAVNEGHQPNTDVFRTATGTPRHSCRENLHHIGGHPPFDCVICGKRYSRIDLEDLDRDKSPDQHGEEAS